MIIQGIHWFFSLKQKSQVAKTLENFIDFIQTQFETAIKIIRNDNETEFLMTNFFLSTKE